MFNIKIALQLKCLSNEGRQEIISEFERLNSINISLEEENKNFRQQEIEYNNSISRLEAENESLREDIKAFKQTLRII